MLDLARELAGEDTTERTLKERRISPAEFWKQKLAGWTTPTPIAITIPTKMPGSEGADFCTGAIGERTSAALRRAADQIGVPLPSLFIGAWALLLHRYSGEEDVVFGLVKGCVERDGDPDTAVPHIVPARVLLKENDFVRGWLRRLADAAKEAGPYEFISLSQIREAAAIPSNIALFHSVVSVGNGGFDPLGITASGVGSESRFPLVGAAYLGREITLRIGFATGMFSEEAIALMLGHWAALIEGMAANPDVALSAVPITTLDERLTLTREWNQTAAPYPDTACVQQLVEEQVARTPDVIAAVFGDRSLTYRELNARANTLAHHLRASGAGADSVIGICMDRSLEAVVAVLGVLKAGASYLPLDPSYPHERLQFMLLDARVQTLLTQKALAGIFPEPPRNVICLDERWFATAQAKPANPDIITNPENLAYLIYTSGSTGKPKGVAMVHRPLVNLLEWQRSISKAGPGDRTLQFTSLSFDVSFQEIFSTWCTGGTLMLIPAALRLSPRDLWSFIVRAKIMRIFLPFVALQQLADAAVAESTQATALREVITAGEQLQITPRVREMFAQHPEASLHNHYGPSETHVVTALTLQGDPNQWPALPAIGRPIANTSTLILDSHMAPLPVGIPGELFIGGVALARGYFERPETTASKFIANPFSTEADGRLYRTGDLARYLPDGNIEFLGRIDHQVKIRGYRVELGEVENAINKQHGVRECAVIAREGDGGLKQLVAYVVAENEAALTVNQLRQELKVLLPDYMVPGAMVFLEKLPLTPSGKVDRRALPAPVQVDSDPMVAQGEMPWLPIQLQLVQLWQELLNVKPIGLRDNFFELGGHSLLAVRMMDRVEQLTGKKLPVTELFNDATIAHLSELIVRSDAEQNSSPSVVELCTDGTRPPIYFLHGDIIGGGFYARDLSRLLGPDQPFYVLPPASTPDGTLTTVEEMAETHLRDLRAHRPHGPYILGGFCIGALVAYEMGRRLAAEGEEVPWLVLIDPQLPSRLLRAHFLAVEKLAAKRGSTDEDKLAKFAFGQKLLFRLRQEWNASLPSKARFAVKAAKKIWARGKRVPQPAENDGSAPVANGAFNDEEQRILASFHWLSSGYVPPRYEGAGAVFITDEQLDLTPFLPRRWQEAAPNFEIIRVPGQHLGLITTDIAALTNQLKERLDQLAPSEAELVPVGE